MIDSQLTPTQGPRLPFVAGQGDTDLAPLKWLMKYITTHSFMPFVIYRIVLGLLLFALVAVGVLDPQAGEDVG